ncbi:MBA family surface membrane protein [Ureaplasma urealyticum]|uniref:MBA family surface membrane protein n=1 Tax=Ureaplasma urealyticum TaxID=2130 RepID=UPI00017490D7|nr:DUF1410 domain-containing protein [Ureaplasma urealyticum]EDU56613.1 multiple banded antigen [Ureaplasma urealyticum serovar 7 str. ATCC 27819]
MKLLKNKKFWAITLGVTLVGAGVVAVAASCSSSNVKSKLSSQLVKSKDEKSFYAVYDIENFDDLTENDKKALNETEFNVAITSVENKTENATIKGHLLNKKIYVKLPREPKAKEQLTIINKGGLLKTASLALPDNLNYQTEKVDFGNTPTTSPTPTPTPTPEPTPTPKKDEAVVSSVEFKKVENKKDEATVSLVFSKLELADASKKIFVLEVTKKGETTPIQASDLKYDEASKTLSGKLSNLKEGSYTLSKLTLNDNEISLSDELKKIELKVEPTNEQSNQQSKPSDKDQKVKEAQAKLDEANKALTASKATLTTKEEVNKKASAEATKASEELEAAKKDVTTKQQAVDQATKDLEAANKLVEDKEIKVKEAQAKLDEANKALTASKATLTTKEEVNKKASAEATKASEELEAAKKDVTTKQQAVDQATKDLEAAKK